VVVADPPARRTVALRTATPADDDFIHASYASTRTEELAQLPWTDAEKHAFLHMQDTARSASYRHQWPDAVVQVIEVDGQPAGCLCVSRTPEEIRVLDIALVPGQRGTGIGTRLLRALQSVVAHDRLDTDFESESDQIAAAEAVLDSGVAGL